MNKPATVAVVILNWNGARLLRRYLPSVLEHTPSRLGEVIVADNGSTDDSLSYCHEEAGVRTLVFEQNYGFAGGYNRAIAALPHDYVLLLNSDVEVSKGWLEPLVQCLDTHPKIAAVQPTLRAAHAPDMYEYAGAQGGYLDRWGYPFCRGRIFDTVEVDRGQYGSQPQLVGWTTGAAMLIRRELYLECGGLDESFFAHQEEIDLCWRLRRRGWQLAVVPESRVYHVGGASLESESPRKTYLNFRNNLSMLWRNLPQRRLAVTLSVRLLLDGAAALHFLVGGKPRNAAAVIRGWYHFIKQHPKRDGDEGAEEAYRQHYRHLLLWQYHALRHRTFATLPDTSHLNKPIDHATH